MIASRGFLCITVCSLASFAAESSETAAREAQAAAIRCLEREAPRIERVTEDLETAARALINVNCAAEVRAVADAILAGMSQPPRIEFVNEMRARTATGFMAPAMRFLIAAREANLKP